VASVNTGDARTLFVKPWEKKLIDAIEKAIIGANLGFNPSNNGESVIIHVPMLTEERRKGLGPRRRMPKGSMPRWAFAAAVRRPWRPSRLRRRTAYPRIPPKSLEAEVEKLTGIYNKKVEALIEAKEKDIMKV
jgi:ribosome recycling factor